MEKLQKMRSKLMQKLKNKKGFTLVEMIVVLAIIAILIALIAPNVSRLVGNAQGTSDAAKSKNVLNVAQTFATDAITAGYAPSGTKSGTAPNQFYLLSLDSSTANTTMQDFFKSTVGTATTSFGDSFMDATGNSYLPVNTLGGSDKIYMYFSTDGNAMASVYVNGDDVIKAVSGTAPTGIAPAGIGFVSKELRNKYKVTPASGAITAV